MAVSESWLIQPGLFSWDFTNKHVALMGLWGYMGDIIFPKKGVFWG